MPCIVLALFLAFFTFINFRFPNELLWDQYFITYRLAWADFPNFDAGILSSVLVGVFNSLFSPGDAHINPIMKTLAMFMYSLGAYALAKAVLKTSTALLLFVVMLFLSRYPLLWLSSELFAGAFLTLAIAGLLRRWPAWLAGVLLACAGLCKPDVMLAAAALLLYHLALIDRPQRLRLFAGYGTAFLLLVGPAALRHRGALFAGRSFFSFGQHYAALFEPHQIHRVAAPWVHWREYVNASFPGATSVLGAARQHPLRYLDFVVLSAATGLRFAIKTIHVLTLSTGARIAEGLRQRLSAEAFEKYILVSLIGVVPWVLLSFPHVRYMARYYPPMILVSLRWMEWTSRPRLARTLIYAAIALQAVIFLHEFIHPQNLHRLWRPD